MNLVYFEFLQHLSATSRTFHRYKVVTERSAAAAWGSRTTSTAMYDSQSNHHKFQWTDMAQRQWVWFSDTVRKTVVYTHMRIFAPTMMGLPHSRTYIFLVAAAKLPRPLRSNRRDRSVLPLRTRNGQALILRL
jgi:hypothetical protein